MTHLILALGLIFGGIAGFLLLILVHNHGKRIKKLEEQISQLKKDN